MATGDVSWDYQNLIPPLVSGCRGTLDARSAQSARSSPARSGAIRFFLDQHGRTRDRALFDLAIDSKLRGCDLVKIKISDIVCDRKIRTRAIVVQQKTGRPVQFELMDDARASLLRWLELRGGSLEDYAFPSRTDHATHMSTRQYARLVDEWVTGIGLPSEDYGTHSLRRTKASIIYKATGICARSRSCLGIRRLKAPSDISEWMWRTP